MNRPSNKKTFVFILIVIFLGGMFYLKFREKVLPTAKIKINEAVLQVELAENPFSWKKGLGGREFLSPDKGMLFVFAVSDRPSIWMKDMKFPIDIVWIDKGKIVDIAPDVKPTMIDPLPIYLPRLPAKFVLEVNAGMAQKYGWKIGDGVSLLTK